MTMRPQSSIKRLIISVLAISLLLVVSCKKDSASTVEDTFDIEITLPGTLETSPNESVTLTVNNAKAPVASDVFLFTGSNGAILTSHISSVTSKEVTITMPENITTGNYTVSVKRDERKKVLGKTYVNIVSKIDFTPDASSTVYGAVLCDGKGVANVVISDGVEVTTTNDKGFYQIASQKKYGYVFISVPSGYEVPSTGILPTLHQLLRNDANTVERVDFQLNKVSNQDNYTLLVFGDMHLARRTNDLAQFRQFTSDVSSYLKSHTGDKIYGITLGDMTWDLYWYSNTFALPDYLSEINSDLSGIEIFHTMGNHDNDMMTYSDLGAEASYIHTIAPDFYSFNIGKTHYIVLDDIDCSNYDGTSSRSYVKLFSDDEYNWLRKDLSHVSKSTPLIITAHAPIYNITGASSFGYDGSASRTANSNELINIISGYKTDFITGHTHVLYNVTPTDAIIGGKDIREHNSGAVCASWWWSGYINPGYHICTDGAPGGYQIFTINGTDMKWQYKATGKDISYQFRTYDRNSMSISASKFAPNATGSSITTFNNHAADWASTSSENYVYFNVWNYDQSWKISVTENGKELAWTRVLMKDPLHLIAYEAGRANVNGGISFATTYTNHFFRVKASSPNTTLDFKITDEFGNVYTETMTRPKEFSLANYK